MHILGNPHEILATLKALLVLRAETLVFGAALRGYDVMVFISRL
jgi:hypothetical protein